MLSLQWRMFPFPSHGQQFGHDLVRELLDLFVHAGHGSFLLRLQGGDGLFELFVHLGFGFCEFVRALFFGFGLGLGDGFLGFFPGLADDGFRFVLQPLDFRRVVFHFREFGSDLCVAFVQHLSHGFEPHAVEEHHEQEEFGRDDGQGEVEIEDFPGGFGRQGQDDVGQRGPSTSFECTHAAGDVLDPFGGVFTHAAVVRQGTRAHQDASRASLLRVPLPSIRSEGDGGERRACTSLCHHDAFGGRLRLVRRG
mmetsp:Transcript_4118/g.25967  ORF Transcript_4118/g.25967 Transcript_4118/m.25967 type:complete len:252 (-) Transcript_4118:30-785(-)